MKKIELFKFILYRYLIDMKLFSSKLMQMNILFNIININIIRILNFYNIIYLKLFLNFLEFLKINFLKWGLGIGPNPQSPIPNPQSPIPII